jgi:hypothetical protein
MGEPRSLTLPLVVAVTVVLSLGSQLATPAIAGEPAKIASAESAVRATVGRFLSAFERLDMPGFIACFADDATVFFPLPEPAERFDGKPAIQQHFQQVFAAIRSAASAGPPYQQLIPQDLEVKMLGPNAAIVS